MGCFVTHTEFVGSREKLQRKGTHCDLRNPVTVVTAAVSVGNSGITQKMRRVILILDFQYYFFKLLSSSEQEAILGSNSSYLEENVLLGELVFGVYHLILPLRGQWLRAVSSLRCCFLHFQNQVMCLMMSKVFTTSCQSNTIILDLVEFSSFSLLILSMNREKILLYI